MDTEPTTEVVEPTEPVSVVEQTGEVSPEVSVVSFSQEQVDKMLADKGKEWQSSKDKEFSDLTAKNRDLESKTLEAQEVRERDNWGDTDEVKEFQAERRRQAEATTTLREDQARVRTEVLKSEYTARLIRAKELSDEHGIPIAHLNDCQTPADMDKIVTLWTDLKEKSAPVQKVDSGVPSAAGLDTKDWTATQFLEYAVAHPNK